jgi:hypothetical protein
MPREPRLAAILLCVAANVTLLAEPRAAAAQILPADRATAWNPGIPGGVPTRTTVCATVNASTYGSGSSDASAGIQAAINGCPVGQVVKLSAGTFKINTSPLVIARGISLRGAGPGVTFLKRTNGAVEGSGSASVSDPVVIIGPNRWPGPNDSTSTNLTLDGAKGASSVMVASASGFAAGQIVLLDEDDYNTGAWTSLPNRNGSPTSVKIWATDRAVWARSNPSDSNDDPFPSAADWFMRFGRPIAEIKEVASVSGNGVSFTTPLHISYRVSHTAQLTRYTGSSVHVRNAGIEDLTVQGGGDGNVRFECAAYSWMRNVEDASWLGEGVAIDNSFRVEVRDSHIHHTVWPSPGGGGYCISLAEGSSEVLLENNIVMDANKVMVARSSGAGSVVGYNYMDDGFINYDESWQEVGINGSHMVGSHHMLFEGNESFNYDSDSTHGNAIYHTVFRNHLSGIRRDFPGLSGARAAGLMYGSWWHSLIGNVLGTEGETGGWVYQDSNYPWGGPAMWKLGYDPQHWEQDADPKVLSTVLRQGNFDYASNLVHWDTTAQPLPSSLYLKSKPAFFGSLPWPWVDPTGTTKLHTLPARARFEGGPQPSVSVNDVSVTEGNSGTKTVQFTVSLSAGSSATVTVNYATANGTAQAGSDYIAALGTLTFSPGSVQRTVSITINGDTTVEPNETLLLKLSNPTGATLGDSQGVASIVNDDSAALPSLRINDVPVTEGNSGTVNATFTVTLSAASSQTVGVSYATADGTATAASGDYANQVGSLSFSPGQTVKTIAVVVRGDTAAEANETFFVNLSSPTNATLADAQGRGTIMNNDSAGAAVTWTRAVGVSVSGNNLTKTAAPSWSNAGAVSSRSLTSGDGYVEFRATESTTRRMVGLSNGDTDQNFADIDFAVFLRQGGTLQIYEKGVLKGSFGTYAPGDLFRVSLWAGVVRYYRNGTLLYTSGQAPRLPLLVDSSLYDTVATITSAVISGNWQ